MIKEVCTYWCVYGDTWLLLYSLDSLLCSFTADINFYTVFSWALPHTKERDKSVQLSEEGREMEEKELWVVQFSSEQFPHQPSPVNVSEWALKDCGVVLVVIRNISFTMLKCWDLWYSPGWGCYNLPVALQCYTCYKFCLVGPPAVQIFYQELSRIE